MKCWRCGNELTTGDGIGDLCSSCSAAATRKEYYPFLEPVVCTVTSVTKNNEKFTGADWEPIRKKIYDELKEELTSLIVDKLSDIIIEKLNNKFKRANTI